MSLLYIVFFGSFIGYSFAFGLVLQTQFGRTLLQAAAVTLHRPADRVADPARSAGWLADRLGGARGHALEFLAMAASTLLVHPRRAGAVLAGPVHRRVSSACSFFSGVGNGSTYKMIPAIFRRRRVEIAEGAEEGPHLCGTARRVSGAPSG